jgi:Uma2 family endonuclease
MVSLSAEPEITPSRHVVLRDVSWELYESLLREIGDQHVLITYDNGSMELMSPLPEHEGWKKVIARLIETLTEELDIPIAGLGSTTYRRRDLAKGLEPDECYYVQHETQVRGKKRLDLRSDPPPDLVVEIDITHRDLAREPIYAALGVPELWRFDGRQLRSERLTPDGTYEVATNSAAFPFLQVADLEPFLAMVPNTDQTTMIRAFRRWVRERFPETTSSD